MATPRFARPKSLYIEATAIMDDGTETVVRMKLEPDDSRSELTLDMENLFNEDEDALLRPATRYVPTTNLHNVKVEFSRCRAVDPPPLD